MNYQYFCEVTQENNQGRRVGMLVNTRPEYQEIMQNLRQEFNVFSSDICPEGYI